MKRHTKSAHRFASHRWALALLCFVFFFAFVCFTPFFAISSISTNSEKLRLQYNAEYLLSLIIFSKQIDTLNWASANASIPSMHRMIWSYASHVNCTCVRQLPIKLLAILLAVSFVINKSRKLNNLRYYIISIVPRSVSIIKRCFHEGRTNNYYFLFWIRNVHFEW